MRKAVTICSVFLIAAGLFGAYRYVWTFWLYRGFPPPPVPSIVSANKHVSVPTGTVLTISVWSRAVDATLPAIVYLPPGYYSHPRERFPTMYLLHGVPGGASQYVDVGDVATVEADLVAEHKMPPTILVMPQGPNDFLADTEWANLPEPRSAWMTYVARDVVLAVDHRFRAMNNANDRAIAGLSEGGYGALNIALHHLNEFHVVESWSGYMLADNGPTYFGKHPALFAANSPSIEVRRERNAVLRSHLFIWFYCGSHDYEVAQNKDFNVELRSLGIPHIFFLKPGHHDWSVWRPLMGPAFVAAGAHFAGVSR